MTFTGMVPVPIEGMEPTVDMVPVINTWYSHQTAASADDRNLLENTLAAGA